MSGWVTVPEKAIALEPECPICEQPAGIACARSGGAVMGGGRHALYYVHPERCRAAVRCDFCLAHGPQWVCPCRDYEAGFRSGDPEAQRRLSEFTGNPNELPPWERYKGAWLACDTCAELIVLTKRGHLVRRAWEAALVRVRAEEGEQVAADVALALRGAMIDQYDLFWANREGPPVTLTDSDVIEYASNARDELVFVEGKPQRIAPWEWRR